MHRIFALWAHPRSMSTALERLMRERGDLICAHEPFMYDYYVARGVRKMPGFDVQPDHPVGYEAVRDMLLEKAGAGPVFFKDMAFYVVPRILKDPAFLDRVSHSFLVRHPLPAILSYYKLDPALTCEEIGIEAQWRLYEAARAAGQPAAVIEAEAVRADPRGAMRAYWRMVGLDWRDEAFDWGRETPQAWEQVSAWHEEVRTSSGIRAADAEEMLRKELEFDALAEKVPELREYLAHHMPFYRRLSEVALGV